MQHTKTREDTVKVCHCEQCRFSKRKKSKNVKRWFKRMTNKKRRAGKVYSLYYA